MAHRFEAGTELRLRLANALRNRPHLAVLGGVQHHDAIRLAQLVGSQHDPGVSIQLAHDSALRDHGGEPTSDVFFETAEATLTTSEIGDGLQQVIG